jgi:hypothetical protein
MASVSLLKFMSVRSPAPVPAGCAHTAAHSLHDNPQVVAADLPLISLFHQIKGFV